MDTFEELSTKQQKLISLLLTEKTIEEACNKAKVATITYWRWMQEEKFLSEYRKARRGILENTVAKLQSSTFKAIETLERNLNCENPSSEIRAAQIILEQSIKGLEILDIENRLWMVEQMIKVREENE